MGLKEEELIMRMMVLLSLKHKKNLNVQYTPMGWIRRNILLYFLSPRLFQETPEIKPISNAIKSVSLAHGVNK